jgi:transcriptional regulator with XRE-family HTH domain
MDHRGGAQAHIVTQAANFRADFRAARETCGFSQADFAIALGYRNHDRQGLRQQVNDMEAGRKAVTPQVARLAEMFRRFGIPPEFMVYL